MSQARDALAALLDGEPTPEAVRRSLDDLLDRDPALGTSVAFDLLASEPRIKPSRGLLIDPTDSVRRRWSLRVAAGAALVSSPAAARVFAELLDELSEDPDLAHDVLAIAVPHASLGDDRRAALQALLR